jgi:HD-GYP domain-containing protein (c-di-GMP phosphodiesterase class II)
MPFFSNGKADLRLGLLLFTAFLIVGAAGIASIYQTASVRFKRDVTQELTTVARLATLQINAEAHEKLRARPDMALPEYHELNQKLSRVLRQVPELRYIYTLRKEGDQYHFVLDPTPAGDADQDGIQDKSYLMDPYPEIEPSAMRVFKTGTALCVYELTSDRWGTFLSAYAPILDKNGKVVAILGVDREAKSLIAHQRKLLYSALASFLVVVICAAFFTLLLVRQIRSGSYREVWLRNLMIPLKHFRLTLLELVLCALACYVLIGGGMTIVGSMQSDREERETHRKLALLEDMRNLLGELRSSPSPAADQIEALQRKSATAGLAGLASQLSGLREMDSLNDAEIHAELAQVSHALKQEFAHHREQLERFYERSLDRTGAALWLIGFTTVLTLGSLFIVRAASGQQQQLHVALNESQKHQGAYQELVENLPVGLYTYSRGDFMFSNWAWDEQTMRQPGQDRHAALLSVLHPDDRDLVLDSLKNFERHEEPFQLQYRLVSEFGDTRYFESRGVPVYTEGSFDHMLAFNVDITGNVLAHRQLQEKNKEVESKNRMLRKALGDLEENFEAMVRSLVKAVEAKDFYTAGHSERVMSYSVRIGELLGLSPNDLRLLEMGTLIHDIGKIGVPDAILTKPSALTNEEFAIVKLHPVSGYEMVKDIPVFKDCAPIVLWHHERLDGSGYPHGLKGDDIPLLVRIASVADAFDAMTSTRAYRRSRDARAALEEVEREAEAGCFDEKIVEILADIVNRDGVLWQASARKAA